MHRIFCIISVVVFAFTATSRSAERAWTFSDMAVDQPPKGCFSTVAGEGKPGTWKILIDEMPLALQPLSTNAPKTSRQPVVAQVARDYSDKHFPMLVLGDAGFDDFTFKTKFKIVDGLTEQIAAVAFRIQDEKNFYYVKADANANKVSFCGVLKGNHATLYSSDQQIPKGVWHDLSVECFNSKIQVIVDGQFLVHEEQAKAWLSDTMFAAGKIAFCTKSDSIAYFADAHITYKPKEAFVQSLVREVMKENPRLLGLKILMVPPNEKEIRLVASNNEAEVGKPGEKYDTDVLARGIPYYQKENETIFVTMPLRDRNGDPVAAVRFVMKSFPGQTQENAMVRVTPLIKRMQKTASAVESLY
jgi:hypothetical protein